MLEDKVLKTIKKYNLIESNDIVIVAVSGGPDSMCLLNSLNNLKEKLKIKKIVVAHVNHMLREEAESETQFVKDFCNKNNIEIFVKYANIKSISEHNKTGEEETGRKERYAFFEKIAKNINANKIAIAHNMNDNAETVFMHMFRGSGISGLIGIQPSRDNRYIRPIIECTRDEIERYCDEKKLDPKHDKSNDDNTYTRNKTRNVLIPYIKKEYNPNIIETIKRLSDSVLVEEKYMKKMTNCAYEDVLINKNENRIVIDLKKFNKLDDAIKPRLILYIVKLIFGTTNGIEKIHIDDIIKMCEKNVGNKFLKPNKYMKVYLKSGMVSFEKVLK